MPKSSLLLKELTRITYRLKIVVKSKNPHILKRSIDEVLSNIPDLIKSLTMTDEELEISLDEVEEREE